MLRGIKIRIYPDEGQKQEINKLLGCCRFVYNRCLDLKITAYKDDKTSLSTSDLNKKVIEIKKQDEFVWLADAHSKVIQQSLLNLDSAYKKFFKEKSGFPKFKSKKEGDSCRFPVDAIGGIKGNRVNLTKKINNILFKCSVKDEKYLNKHQSLIKSATLRKTLSGNCMLSILIDRDVDKSRFPRTNGQVGIDIGIKDFVITSEGEVFENIKSNRRNALKLASLQRQISRKQKKSKNRDKARIKFARFNETLKNKKKYYLHSVVNSLLNENQIIAIEDLNVKGMMKNHNLAKSIQELSIGEFTRILQYKASWYNKAIVKIDRWFPSSKLCSCCGYKNKNLTLKDREWTCPNCNTAHDRDHNAAVNILAEALRLCNEQIGLSKPELTLVEIAPVDDPARNGSLKSMQSMKQEEDFVRNPIETKSNRYKCLCLS